MHGDRRDGIYKVIWHQSVFGSAYAIKITMNNAMNIILRIMNSVLQNCSPASNPYLKVTPVYVVFVRPLTRRLTCSRLAFHAFANFKEV